MAFSRANGGGWGANAEVTTTQVNTIDADLSKAVDGAAGGSYAPTVALTVAGQGLQMTLGTAPSTWMQFAEGTRSITRSFAAQPVSFLAGGAGLGASGYVGGNGGGIFTRLLEVPNNATVVSLKLYFKIVIGHGAVPTTGPGISLTRLTSSTGAVVALAPVTPLYMVVPLSVATYENGGAIQSLLYTATQNNTAAARGTQQFFFTVVDEAGGGALAGNLFYGFDLTYTLLDLEVA